MKEADVPCARCLDRDEVLAQDQLVANDTVEVIDHPVMGKMRVIKAPPRFGGEVLEPGTPSPEHGQHTRAVLESFAIDNTRLNQMFEDGLVS